MEKDELNVPTFTELNGNDLGEKLGGDSVSNTEATEVNEGLESFISETSDNEPSSPKEAKEEIEKLTESAARYMVSNGLANLLGFASHALQADLMLTQPEIDSFAEDIAPLMTKYANRIERAPPWLKALMKYKTELIAVKGMVMLSVSIYFKFKQAKAELELAKQQQEAELKAQYEAEQLKEAA